MIPRRVEVEGFLCYRDRQVVELDGSDLWVFSGPNGSGKSTIFDAISLAVFGVYRGSDSKESKGLENLIHAGSPEFRVVFEFDLGPDRFTITRGYRRGGRSYRQASRREVDDLGRERWLPVPETEKQEGLDRWVERNVGLNYEMFTCSMMLRQGHAERLLEASPKQRFEIVAEVADLKSYRLLSEKAEARRKDRKGQVELIRSDLARRPVVEPLAIEEAEARLSGAKAARAVASDDRDRLAAIEVHAHRWRELAAAREKTSEEAERARRIIESSTSIEAGWNRLRELDGVLPALVEEAARRAEVAEREAAVSDRRARREDFARQFDGSSRLAEESSRRLAEILGEIDGDEARKAGVVARRAGLAAPIARARGAAEQGRAVDRLEATMAAYPPDLEEEAARLGVESARRAEAKEALRPLEDLAAAREGLAGARSRVEAGGRAIADGVDRVRRAGDGLEAARDEASRARLAREDAARRATEARTILRSARTRLEVFEDLQGSTACDRCGQPLTPEHYADEARRLLDDRDQARRVNEEAGRSLAEAEGRASSSELAVVRADRMGREAETALAEARRGAALAESDASKHEAACAKAMGDLEVFSRPGTTFPRPVDLAEARRLVDGLPEAERLARQARSRLEAMEGDRLRLEEARRALGRLGLLPGDEEAEAEDSRLAAEAESLDRCLNGHRRDRAAAEEDLKRLAKERETAMAEIIAIDSLLATDRALIRASREASARALDSITGPWLAAFESATAQQLETWESERRSLRDRGIRELAAELPRARWGLDSAEAALADLDARLAEVPEEARRDPVEVAERRKAAAARLEVADEEVRGRQGDLDALRRAREDRADLEARALEADRSLAVSSKLAELLGRGSLQRHLIRDAERGILDCANPILRDISGNDLELRLSVDDGGDDQALQLEVVDRTHGAGRALGVAFLSGSQRFRVAVSLALGIGQYARGLDRPIQSVVIDEGFGCLDRQGRDEMIAQLAALKGRLARVVLVSHQEEFAEAFKDGYRFEIRDGSTVVEEFHR